MRERIDWIDRWRGVLIFQIVAFHVLGVAVQANGSGNEILTASLKWIERYHVLAFFALTGVVWKRKSSFKEFLLGKIRRLLVPYFVFGGLWALCFVVLSHRFSCSYASIGEFAWWQPFASVVLCNGYPNGMGARVVNALWFLPSLFGVSLAYFVVDRYLPNRTHQLLLLLPLYALRNALVGMSLPWDVNRIPYFMMFVILARWAIPCSPSPWIEKHRIGGVLVALALYAFAECRPFVRACFDLMGVGAWAWVFVSMVLIGASAILAQSVKWKTLDVVGKASLGILVFHKFPILAIQAIPSLRKIAFGQGGLSLCLTVSVGVTLVSIVATEAVRRIAPWTLGERKMVCGK